MSEVYVHIANGNFLLLSLTAVKLPAEYFPSLPPGAKGKPDTQAVFKRMGRTGEDSHGQRRRDANAEIVS